MCQNRSGGTSPAKTAATENFPPGPSARRAPTGLGKRLGGVLALGFSVATTLLSGCVVVKPYQREQLAERCMSPGFGDASELKFRAHWEGSRQGGEGGFGTAGGGCGCN